VNLSIRSSLMTRLGYMTPKRWLKVHHLDTAQVHGAAVIHIIRKAEAVKEIGS
jgi:hypothetical protein